MGWFDRLLGREKVKAPHGEELKGFSKRGWTAISEEKRAATTHEYLEMVAAALGISQPVVVPAPQSHSADLRGSASGFPLKITVSYNGSIEDIAFRYADTKLESIDLEYDPQMPAAPVAVEPWDASDKQVILAPQIFTEGSDAEQEAAQFRELPRELQQRVLSEIRRLRIRYFRSRREEFGITLHDNAIEVAEPVQWLVDVMSLALEVAGARGAVPPGQARAKAGAVVPPNVGKIGMELATKISRAVIGAKLVKRPNEEKLDVRWTEGSVPVRVVVDLDFEDLEVEVRVEDLGGSFHLYFDPEVSVEQHPDTGDPWDDFDRHVFFAKSVYVHGAESTARREAAMLKALGPSLLDELVRTMEELGIDILGLEDQLLSAALGDLEDLPPDADTRAIRVARLLARVARELPRGELAPDKDAIRCTACHGLWFQTIAQRACTHCGTSA